MNRPDEQLNLFRTGALVAVSASAAAAQELMVVDNTNKRVLLVSAVDGTVTLPIFIDLTMGSGTPPGTLIQAFDTGTGEIWITDQTQNVVHRWTDDGTTYLGEWGTGRDDIRGIHLDFNRAWICNSGTGGAGYGFALKEYSLATTFIAAHTFPGSPFGITSHGDKLLVSDTTNDNIVSINPMTGNVFSIFHNSNGVTGIDSPGQLTETSEGTVLAAGAEDPAGIFEYSGGSGGFQLNYFDSTAFGSMPQGVHGLSNGNILLGTDTGLLLYDRVAGLYSTVVGSIDANFITPLRTGVFGTNFCSANNNSTGGFASMSALGSLSVATNNLTLRTTGMPQNSFGFIITSRDASFVSTPLGSQGNLCLGGAVGRYVGPGQIQNSGASGSISVAADLSQHPTPFGFVQVLAGNRWRFTTWYRDANPMSTSNFSDGLELVFTN